MTRLDTRIGAFTVDDDQLAQDFAVSFVSEDDDGTVEARLQKFLDDANAIGSFVYRENAETKIGASYLEMNKENIVKILQIFIDQMTLLYLGAQPLDFLEQFLVDESPKPTWSHGH
jgi:hypothetical protein